MKEHILYELSCENIAIGDAEDAEKTTCRCHIHNQREPIVRVITSEWLSNCHDCIYRRWCGNDKSLAREKSRRHWLRNPNHKTSETYRRRGTAIDTEYVFKKKVADMGWVWYNGRVKRPPERPTEKLPDIPPF